MVQLNCYWNRDERYYTGKNWKEVQTSMAEPCSLSFLTLSILCTGCSETLRIYRENSTTSLMDLSQHSEDSGFVNFSFVNGGMGSINYSTSVWDKNLENSITIIGEKRKYQNWRTIHERSRILPHWELHNAKLPPASPANDYGSYKGSAANHHFIIENVIDTLKVAPSRPPTRWKRTESGWHYRAVYSLRKLKNWNVNLFRRYKTCSRSWLIKKKNWPY